VQIDPVRLPAEAKVDPVVDGPFATQALADTAGDEQIDRALFQHAGSHCGFHVLARTDFQHDRFHAAQIEQVRKQQPRRTSSDDRDLRPAGLSHG
jgi:hypothetical protein